ncbi:MAG TPA: FecR domain-containing protein, partial [Polyangiaceae bacterium]|nr:FecR domain-containing protein [Polyangiaceae bacterium]
MNFKRQHVLLIGGALACAGLMALMLTHANRSGGGGVRTVVTIGDMRTIHAGVEVAGHSVLGDSRLSEGDAIVTGPDGRARIRLDDGTLVVVDASTEVHLGSSGLSLEHGRLYVQGGLAAKTQVSLGNLATSVSSSAAAFEKREKTQIYCAQGELAVSQGSSQEHVALGETLTLVQGAAKVAPEAAFDDWTGGLAVPWSGEEDVGSAMPELRATNEESSNPLTVRKESLSVTIDGEVARTRTTTTYFNGNETNVDAEVRLRLPRGAILAGVTQQYEDSQKVDGSLLLTNTSPKPVNAGRLEWAGAGWLRGMLPAIPAGKTVELSLEYLEWLPLRDHRTTYRFPLAQGEQSPLVAELEAHVDASRSGTPWISASSGARVVSDRVVELAKSDLRPTGDLVVELEPSVAKPGCARAYVQPAGKEDAYVLVRTEVPEVPDPSVRLALVVDTSMSVGSAGLETERAVVESILQGLGAHDSLVVLAADQTLRALGSGVPAPMTPALRDKLEQQLSELRPGGASNLGSALE